MIRVCQLAWPTRTVLLAAAEALLVAAAWLLAAGLAGSDIAISAAWLARLAGAGAACALCLYFFDLYEPLMLRQPRAMAPRVLQTLGTTSLLLALVYLEWPPLAIAIEIFLPGILLAGLLLLLFRGLFAACNLSAAWAQNAVLVGSGPLADAVAAELRRRPELGLRLVELGASGQRIRRVIAAGSEAALPALRWLRAAGVRIETADSFYEALTGRVPLETLGGGERAPDCFPRPARCLCIYKRAFAAAAAGAGLLLAAPLMLAVAAAIRLDSPGPALFRQARVGYRGQLFLLYKFRSMHARADASGLEPPAIPGDRRFTRLGAWLRRTRLDELPQLWNILRGDMDLVGPRPFVPSQERALAQAIPGYSLRWEARPGMTGWAQVRRGYCASEADNRDKLGYDLFYLKHMSAALDWLILFETAKTVLLGRGSR